jgi:predicted transcriptional regulator
MARPDTIATEPSAEDIAFIDAVKTGQASLDQGRSVSYASVRDWLLSWGSDDELPPPECP